MINPYEFAPESRRERVRVCRILSVLHQLLVLFFICTVGYTGWRCQRDWSKYKPKENEASELKEDLERAKQYLRGVVQRHGLAGWLRFAAAALAFESFLGAVNEILKRTVASRVEAGAQILDSGVIGWLLYSQHLHPERTEALALTGLGVVFGLALGAGVVNSIIALINRAPAKQLFAEAQQALAAGDALRAIELFEQSFTRKPGGASAREDTSDRLIRLAEACRAARRTEDALLALRTARALLLIWKIPNPLQAKLDVVKQSIEALEAGATEPGKAGTPPGTAPLGTENLEQHVRLAGEHPLNPVYRETARQYGLDFLPGRAQDNIPVMLSGVSNDCRIELSGAKPLPGKGVGVARTLARAALPLDVHGAVTVKSKLWAKSQSEAEAGGRLEQLFEGAFSVQKPQWTGPELWTRREFQQVMLQLHKMASEGKRGIIPGFLMRLAHRVRLTIDAAGIMLLCSWAVDKPEHLRTLIDATFGIAELLAPAKE